MATDFTTILSTIYCRILFSFVVKNFFARIKFIEQFDFSSCVAPLIISNSSHRIARDEYFF